MTSPRKSRLLGVVVGLTVAVGAVSVGSGAEAGSSLRAHAVVRGEGISGVVTFEQKRTRQNFPIPGVTVKAKIRGVRPVNRLHGFHIHEKGLCEPPGFTAAGGHFDPGPNGNSNPDTNHPYHLGDLPNLVVNRKGEGRLKHETSRITLSGGPLTVFDADGSAVIVHLNPDQGVPGPHQSGVSGGPRIACGVIQPGR